MYKKNIKLFYHLMKLHLNMLSNLVQFYFKIENIHELLTSRICLQLKIYMYNLHPQFLQLKIYMYYLHPIF